jgi:hypothetical protein
MRQLNFEAEPFGRPYEYGGAEREARGFASYHPVYRGTSLGARPPVFRVGVSVPSPRRFTFGAYPFARSPILAGGSPGSGAWGGHPYGRWRRWPWLHSWDQASGMFPQAGQSSDAVMTAQACLAQLGGNVPQDGFMGPATRQAIQAFQAQAQLPPTGMLDDATMAALGAACSAPAGPPSGGGAPPAQGPPA